MKDLNVQENSRYYVYTLKSKKNGNHYTGYTKDLNRRIVEHNTNKNRKQFTSNNGPWELVSFDIFATKVEAMQHERFLKTGKGREFLKSKLK